MTTETSPAAAHGTSPARNVGTAAGTMALLGQTPLWCWWALSDGGGARSHWLAGVVYLACLTLVLVFVAPPTRPRTAAAVALAGLAGLAGLGAISAAWAPDAGAALGAAAKAALPALALALPLLWPPPVRAAVAAGAALTATGLLAGAVGLARAGADAGTLIDGRLTEPLGYPNAMAALMLMAALPPWWAAAHAQVRWPLRSLCLGAATAAFSLALLSQSRGGAAAVAVVVALALALSPARLRLLAALVVAGGAVAAASSTLLELRLAALEGRTGDSVLRAAVAVIGAAALAALLAPLLERVPAGVRPPSRRIRIAGWIGAAAVVVVAGFALTGGDPAGWTTDRIDSLQTPRYGELESPGAASRFTGDLGSDRTDYWRVALDAGAERPLGGAGAASFAGVYVTRRAVDRYPWFAHSSPLEAFAELGVPGALLVLSVVAGGAIGIAQRRRAIAIAVPLALPAALLIVQGAVDWVAQVPLLSATAAAVGGAALCAGDAPRPLGRPLPGVVAVLAAALAVACVPPLIGARYEEQAQRVWRADPAAALEALRRAGSWQPLDARPRLAEGIVAVASGRPERARHAFAAAADRDANGWFSRLELGLLLARAGEPSAARGRIAQARALNPREPIVRQAASNPGSLDPAATALRILTSPG